MNREVDKKRDLIRIRCCVVLQELNCLYAGSPTKLRRQIFGYPLASSSRTTLTRISPYCLFLLASLGAFLSASCRSPSFLFGGEDYWSGYWWRGIDGRKSRCWLVKMVLIEQANELSKVLDRWGWLPGIFFLWIPFPRHQVVETWQVTRFWLSCIDHAVPNCFHLVFLYLFVACVQFLHVFLMHPLFPCGVLFQQWQMENIMNSLLLRKL